MTDPTKPEPNLMKALDKLLPQDDQTKPPPTPWKKDGMCIVAPFGETPGNQDVIARLFFPSEGNGEMEANAALIVRAVNAHAGLVEALRELVAINEKWNSEMQKIVGWSPNWNDGYLDNARAALRVAGVEL